MLLFDHDGFQGKNSLNIPDKEYVILSFLQATPIVLADAIAMNERVEECEKNEVEKKERNVRFE